MSVVDARLAALRAAGTIPVSAPHARLLRVGVRMARDAWENASRFPAQLGSQKRTAQAEQEDRKTSLPPEQQGEVTDQAVMNQPESDIPEFASRFEAIANSLFSIPTEPRLVRFLPATQTCPQPARVVHHRSRAGSWYEVEVYHARSEKWLLRHTSANQPAERDLALATGARQDATESAEDSQTPAAAAGTPSTTDLGVRSRGRPAKSGSIRRQK
ncbi:hypothetical protein [Burkholderia pseudomallei]|uniref:hypothetical protein n=1 Tax=Burkholderia pseudomallei TaxID=28450 RepID=UPI0012F51AEA|nr:hypothetical protein [Burkholderia pseudomallei]